MLNQSNSVGYFGEYGLKSPIEKFRTFFFVLLLPVAVLLTGCASMSASDCKFTDWFDKGASDGSYGKSIGTLVEYLEMCSKHGITPDRQQYREGHAQGILSYCTKDRGYHFGRSGYPYNDVCPSNLEPDFLDGHNPGYQLWEAEARVVNINDSIDRKRSIVIQLRNEIDKFEDDLDDEDIDEETKKTRQRQITRRKGEIRELEHEIDNLRDEKVTALVNYREAIREVNRLGFDEIPLY